jgi:hypothetical protein
MIDSSSKDTPLSPSEMMMAQDLMESKIAEAKANSKMTHLLMFGNFRMEVVPSKDTNVEEMFKNTLEFLHEKYGDAILNTESIKPVGPMHG